MVDANVTPAETGREGASQKKLPQYLTEAMLFGIIRALGAVPFSIRGSIGWGLGYLVGLLPIRERRFAMLQLKAFLPSVSVKRVTPLVFANAGRTVLEGLRLKPVLTPSFIQTIKCPAWSAVEAWIKQDRPIVALTAHTGNWDLLAAYVIARGIPLTTIGREARNATGQAVLRSIREGYGIETIWRSDKKGLKRLMSCLKERRVIAALIDQDTRVDSMMIPFFGVPAKTPASLISLGRKYNARFVSAFLFRTGHQTFEVYVQEFPDALTEQQLLTEYNLRLESLIRKYPDQWVWFHKRWRTRPDGHTLSSRQYQELLEKRIKSDQPDSQRSTAMTT